MPTRRSFLSAALVGMTAKGDRAIAGSFVNESHSRGHALRDRVPFNTPKRTERMPVVIIGGGIAGLSAAWRLDKRAFRDFVLLEMEPQAGGNSRYGENEITRYPWAAHYIPVPNREAVYVREMLDEFGAMHDGHVDERLLCFSPQERMFIHGRWHPGIEPAFVPMHEREQIRRFDDRIKQFRATREFTVPMEHGAKASPLDSISMADWLKQNKFESSALRWYIDYCCRDDYGALAANTSAWAGIHYHASRGHEERGPVTWPEGNGWIVRRLLAKLSKYVRTNAMVRRVERDGRKLRVLTAEVQYLADRVIFAAPTLIARYLMDNPPAAPMEYSPWLTANLTLDRMPTSDGQEVAWDNVIYDSPSLGYVSATHMSLRTHHERSVWTYYMALASGTPQEQRRALLSSDWNLWKERILADLERAHPDIRQCVSRIDIMRMGHAMARPTPGSLFAEWRRNLKRTDTQVIYANSDVTGFSIFEEAQYRGVKAAEAILTKL